MNVHDHTYLTVRVGFFENTAQSCLDKFCYSDPSNQVGLSNISNFQEVGYVGPSNKKPTYNPDSDQPIQPVPPNFCVIRTALRVLVDTGASASVIIGKHCTKLIMKSSPTTMWSTKAGTFTTTRTGGNLSYRTFIEPRKFSGPVMWITTQPLAPVSMT